MYEEFICGSVAEVQEFFSEFGAVVAEVELKQQISNQNNKDGSNQAFMLKSIRHSAECYDKHPAIIML